MCTEYYEIIEAIDNAGLRTCEYQESWNERVEDLADHIFIILDLCKECGQKIYRKGN